MKRKLSLFLAEINPFPLADSSFIFNLSSATLGISVSSMKADVF